MPITEILEQNCKQYGEEVALAAGDWLKIAPAAKRQFFAGADSSITYVCIQVKENSLGAFTAEDAIAG